VAHLINDFPSKQAVAHVKPCSRKIETKQSRHWQNSLNRKPKFDNSGTAHAAPAMTFLDSAALLNSRGKIMRCFCLVSTRYIMTQGELVFALLSSRAESELSLERQKEKNSFLLLISYGWKGINEILRNSERFKEKENAVIELWEKHRTNIDFALFAQVNTELRESIRERNFVSRKREAIRKPFLQLETTNYSDSQFEISLI